MPAIAARRSLGTAIMRPVSFSAHPYQIKVGAAVHTIGLRVGRSLHDSLSGVRVRFPWADDSTLNDRSLAHADLRCRGKADEVRVGGVAGSS